MAPSGHREPAPPQGRYIPAVAGRTDGKTLKALQGRPMRRPYLRDYGCKGARAHPPATATDSAGTVCQFRCVNNWPRPTHFPSLVSSSCLSKKQAGPESSHRRRKASTSVFEGMDGMAPLPVTDIASGGHCSSNCRAWVGHTGLGNRRGEIPVKTIARCGGIRPRRLNRLKNTGDHPGQQERPPPCPG